MLHLGMDTVFNPFLPTRKANERTLKNTECDMLIDNDKCEVYNVDTIYAYCLYAMIFIRRRLQL